MAPALGHSANTEGLPRIVLAFLGTLQGGRGDTALPLCPVKCLELEQEPCLCELAQGLQVGIESQHPGLRFCWALNEKPCTQVGWPPVEIPSASCTTRTCLCPQVLPQDSGGPVPHAPHNAHHVNVDWLHLTWA